MYDVCLWGQVGRKYLWGTQGCPTLCLRAFGTYKKPTRNVVWMCPVLPGTSTYVKIRNKYGYFLKFEVGVHDGGYKGQLHSMSLWPQGIDCPAKDL